jgi:CheY-like chemotaxis protein
MSTSNRPLILIVDDNVANLALGKAYADALGYDALTVSSGNEALTAFECGKPVAVLMDLKMPSLDGVEAMHKLRDLERELCRFRVPIIAWTACDPESSRQQWEAAGGDGFLPKPFDLEQLKGVLACVATPAEPRSASA